MIDQMNDLVDVSQSWPEDWMLDQENGRYLNRCVHCESMFEGHKRRVSCKACSSISAWDKTSRELQYIKSQFIMLHNTLEKNWNEQEQLLAKILRARCIELQALRYSLLRVNAVDTSSIIKYNDHT